ncbi:restriction endonuclease [Comamonas sp. C11]|uniref:restriction endonuclease n=1 Tax=Comamonas sp. C11 TaxID=2966554 RepID=UPI0021129CCE|nr:restriction endonuclease [Comamonas sp. C11]UUC94469.1 restriction endonuclease [Comamonas sp. C11]
MKEESPLITPDAHLEALIEVVRGITENWAKRHDLWHDSAHRDPINHYNSEPGEGVPILLLCSDGPAITSIEWDDEYAQELREELERAGVYIELEDRATACYYLIDHKSTLQKEFDQRARWQWTCKLIEADSADVSGDLYQHFASFPEDFHRLPHRDFEKLVSSVFAARGWRTELGPGSGDGGVDLRLWQTDPIGDLLTLVQIKRHAAHRPVHLEAVAALEAHVNREGANRGLVVTSSRFLPGVHTFAGRQSYRLQLAEGQDLQAWCLYAAQDQVLARNRALALDSMLPLMQELRAAVTHPRLLVGGINTPSFCVLLRETRSSALLARIPSFLFSGDIHRGQRMPVLDGSVVEDPFDGSKVFRAQRSEENGRVSYWAHRALYWQWDGSPQGYDTWD